MTRLAVLGVGVLACIAAATASADPPAKWPTRGRLGMEVQSMTDALREYFGAPAERGVLVVRVVPDRAAARAGLQVGDVLTGAGGKAVDQPVDLITAVAHVPAGSKLVLEVVRKGRAESVEVAPEGDAVEFSPPPPGGIAGAPHGMPGRDSFDDEVLRRLDSIEQRLQSIEQK